jgi:hypothetical protein
VVYEFLFIYFFSKKYDLLLFIDFPALSRLGRQARGGGGGKHSWKPSRSDDRESSTSSPRPTQPNPKDVLSSIMEKFSNKSYEQNRNVRGTPSPVIIGHALMQIRET